VAAWLLWAPLTAQTPSFTSFDAPDAGPDETFPSSMNQNGMIAGWYYDGGGVAHSFVRSTSGQITEFDPPGLTNSFAVSINLKGQIVGFAARTIDHTSHSRISARRKPAVCGSRLPWRSRHVARIHQG
jgi:hypothetical protein